MQAGLSWAPGAAPAVAVAPEFAAARAAPMAPSATAPVLHGEAPPPAPAVDVAALGLRLRSASEAELRVLRQMGVTAAVRVTNVVAGGPSALQRGDFVIGRCDGVASEALTPDQLAAARCLRIVRDGRVLQV